MADEENQKPEDQQVPETVSETAPESGEDNAAGAAPESVQEEGTKAALEGSEEAIEAIAENVKNRAAEIEDVLAEVSEPSALPKAKEEPQTADETPPAPAKTNADQADDEDEPNLAISVSGETLRISTAHPLIEDIAEQLQKSQRFTLYSVAALCIALLAAVLFYVLMAAQLSSKVKEIDSMLGAMAKRTLQMTKGIESFSRLETRIDQGLTNQLMLQEMLAANEIAVVALNRQLDAMPNTMGTSTKDALSETQQALGVQLQNLETETSRLLTQLERAQRSLDEQSTAVGPLKGMRRELTELKGGLNNVEQTVNDLYVIERARVAKQMRDRGPVELSE
jgi:hypothetical protein